MAFKLSNRSLSKLEGVSNDLVETVKKAIELTSVDFGVIYGVRNIEEQEKLFKSAYQDGEPCWELQVYDNIADAMKEAAVRTGTKIGWGACWHIDDLRDWEGTAEEAMNAYIDLRRSQSRRPFIDGPHFQKN